MASPDPKLALAAAPKQRLISFGSTGQPNMPTGEPPFYPLNPWGRSMPRYVAPRRPVLCQLVVRDRRNGNKETRVGPQMAKPFIQMMCDALQQQIASGAEKRWYDPIVLPMI